MRRVERERNAGKSPVQLKNEQLARLNGKHLARKRLAQEIRDELEPQDAAGIIHRIWQLANRLARSASASQAPGAEAIAWIARQLARNETATHKDALRVVTRMSGQAAAPPVLIAAIEAALEEAGDSEDDGDAVKFASQRLSELVPGRELESTTILAAVRALRLTSLKKAIEKSADVADDEVALLAALDRAGDSATPRRHRSPRSGKKKSKRKGRDGTGAQERKALHAVLVALGLQGASLSQQALRKALERGRKELAEREAVHQRPAAVTKR